MYIDIVWYHRFDDGTKENQMHNHDYQLVEVYPAKKEKQKWFSTPMTNSCVCRYIKK